MITGYEGDLLERHDYLPFGEEWPPRPDEAHVGFGGKERDQETGNGSWTALNYSGARSLASSIGRFTSADPLLNVGKALSDPQQWNRYAYVRNNPLVFVDPDGLACVSATSDGKASVDNDGNPDDCGSSGGTWVPGIVNDGDVVYNTTTHLFQVASSDGANVYYSMFAAGARTDASGKCLDSCAGADIQHADAAWLEGMAESQGGNLPAMIHFMVNRVDPLKGGLLNRLASGPLAFWNNHWAGPAGMGPPHGRGDWTAMAHDDAFRISDIGIGDYFDRSMPAEKSSALIRANHMLIKNAAGVQAVKMGIAFGIIDAFQLITH